MTKNFHNLTSTFKNSIKTWDYFVNWQKVTGNVAEFEIILNKLNYLLGKNDIEKEFLTLYSSNPDIIKVFPTLLAVRESQVEIYDRANRTIQIFDFNHKSHLRASDYFSFLKETNLISLFKESGVKNLVDYVYGVEVGLDSNGRKNRGGTLMESVVGEFVQKFCEEKGFEYMPQANAKAIALRWGYQVLVDKSSRSFDFAVYNTKTKKLKLFETNFYNGGGSKLKAVCGEFKGLQDTLKAQNIDFVWVTDGLGWKTTLRPLEEVYNHNDYIFNLSMLEAGILNSMKW
jgi:hypothetical protein